MNQEQQTQATQGEGREAGSLKGVWNGTRRDREEGERGFLFVFCEKREAVK